MARCPWAEWVFAVPPFGLLRSNEHTRVAIGLRHEWGHPALRGSFVVGQEITHAYERIDLLL